MKVGIRKPSVKKRVKARTTGKVKRAVKKSTNPLYGKKGTGWINNPKKAAYNKVYNKTTVSIDNVVSKNKKNAGGTKDMSNNQKKKTGCLPIVAVALLLIVLLTMCSSGTDDKPAESTTESSKSIPEATTEKKASVQDRITQITVMAEADAEKAEKKDFSTAASYINKHIDDFQNNNKATENMIYYGMLLYYGYGSGNKTSDMGYNAAEAARLVYAKESDIDSDTVQKYISNVKTDLSDMYNPTTEATTEAASQEFPTEHNDVEASSETTCIININSMKFHLINGPDTDSIKPEHRQETTLSKEELINQGYGPCGRCFK